ncbi:Resolvase [Hyella patelloides LEGE 07179]|uniref:Resolvase n=2 Tax=Hyella TaxID=945733 RepID=A0A563W0K9_9CYAN|nr:pre-16S rRNA-processing nuclease YqgF [Hyella patelloides]VEP17063.1 Resolvase [Hyella patelloides LEGE 07179]
MLTFITHNYVLHFRYCTLIMILGFDPGRDKCGVAIVDSDRSIIYHQVVSSDNAIATIRELTTQFAIELIVMGNLTTAKSWQQQLQSAFESITIKMVDERNSTLEARDRYWQMYQPQGLQRLIPQGLRLPPRPIDDIVAILLIERYLLLNS